MHPQNVISLPTARAVWVALLALGPIAPELGASVSQDDAQAAAEAGRPRSVLFYVIDTCRADRMAYDGYSRPTTPFLQWLSERAVVFEACFSQAPWTKPSMASMLTSRYPSQTGVYEMLARLPDEALTWPEVLQSHGLYTAGFSANIVMGNLLSNYAQGFDHFVESSQVNRADPIRFASGSAKSINRFVFPWLDQTDHWPMLLYLHSVDPHEEYEPDASYLAQFADPERHEQFRREWAQLRNSRPDIPGLYVTQDNFDRAGVDSKSFLEHGSNLYDADLRANDDQMQLLWDKLQEDGWGEDFVFVFTSDHGEEFFEHGGTSHGYSLYDEMIRVPLMIYAPGLLPEGVRVRSPVRSLDIFPTLCDLLGIEVPDSVMGESLVPRIRGEAPDEERPILSEHREDPGSRAAGLGSGNLISVRAGPWKFILNQRSNQLLERPRFELYDLEEDPREKRNLADEHPELVRRFELEVATFVATHREGAILEDWVTPDPEVLEQLRKLGYLSAERAAQMSKRDPRAQEKLVAAVQQARPEAIADAVAGGADPNRLTDLDSTLLSLAAAAGHLEVAESLVDAGAEVNGRNGDGSTALITAAFLGRDVIVEFLLDLDADPSIVNNTGASAKDVLAVDWQTTQFIAGLLGVTLDPDELTAGRERCKALLEERTSDEG